MTAEFQDAARTPEHDHSSGVALADLSDRRLMEAVAAGRHDALAEVYRRHGSLVGSLARRLCGHDGADDVVQDVFLRLWQKPNLFDAGRGSLQSFLIMQAYGRAIDSFRAASARRSREAVHVVRLTPSAEEVETTAFTLLASRSLAHLLADLPERERQPIVLAFFGGYSYCHVADLLGEPEGTVKSRVRSGLARLRTRLSSESAPKPCEWASPSPGHQGACFRHHGLLFPAAPASS